MRFWNPATRREVARFEMKSVIHSIAFAPNGSALFVSPRESGQNEVCLLFNVSAFSTSRNARDSLEFA
jgi:hypothetical protein